MKDAFGDLQNGTVCRSDLLQITMQEAEYF